MTAGEEGVLFEDFVVDLGKFLPREKFLFLDFYVEPITKKKESIFVPPLLLTYCRTCFPPDTVLLS